jgi:hypothetical protein
MGLGIHSVRSAHSYSTSFHLRVINRHVQRGHPSQPALTPFSSSSLPPPVPGGVAISNTEESSLVATSLIFLELLFL